MDTFDINSLKKLYLPRAGSHKGQNGKLMIIGGSYLFHGAPLWALKTASRIVDMVFFASIPENNELTQKLKSEIYDFISIPRDKIDNYIKEADVILLGTGLPREEGREEGDESTGELTKNLLEKYPNKKWVLDAGSLTEMDPDWLKQLKGNVVITPHSQEFFKLFKIKIQKSNIKPTDQSLKINEEIILEMAREYSCTILLKGQTDVVCSSFDSAQGETRCVRVSGGNEGMTKGGTGDVLAGKRETSFIKKLALISMLPISATKSPR